VSGWATAGLLVCLLLVATIGFNLSQWMRHRSLAAARGDWTADDFDRAMAGQGIGSDTIAAVRDELASYYMAGLAPRPEDDLVTLLWIDPDELCDIVERLFDRLDLPLPDPPRTLPAIRTVADLASYIDRQPRRP